MTVFSSMSYLFICKRRNAVLNWEQKLTIKMFLWETNLEIIPLWKDGDFFLLVSWAAQLLRLHAG